MLCAETRYNVHFPSHHNIKDACDPAVLTQWADHLYDTVELPDKRLKDRLIKIVSTVAQKPADSIPQAFQHWSSIKGTYRFIENERVTQRLLTKALAFATARDSEGHEVVLAIQDTTALTFPNAHMTKGLGYLTHGEGPGMLLHSVLAARENGVPFGLFDMKFWSRDPKEKGKRELRHKKQIHDKESYKWIQGIRAARKTLDVIPKQKRPRLIHVGDREEDIHEVFDDIIKAGEGAVIRSAQDRLVATKDGRNAYAHELVRQQRPLATVIFEAPRKRTQPKRKATLTLRTCCVTITPYVKKYPHRKPLELNLLEVVEQRSPLGVEPIHWLLWTTEELSTLKRALRVIDIYKKRWKIEEFHLVLKSGCRIEELRMGTAERIAKTISIYAAVAVRIVQIRDLSRLEPETPCTVVLSDVEWRALWAEIHRTPPPPNTPVPSLRQATLWIGKLGGHIGRKSDGMPGVRTLWRGLRDLQLLTRMYVLFHQ